MFMIVNDESVFDDGLDFLKEMLELFDSRLAKLQGWAEKYPDPEDEYEEANYVCGLAFIACQQYIHAVATFSNVGKKPAIATGPTHKSGQTVASLIVDAANFCKHIDDWNEAAPDPRMKATMARLDSAGIDTNHSWVLNEAIYSISPTQEVRFLPLLPLLEKWREEVWQKGGLALRISPFK